MDEPFDTKVAVVLLEDLPVWQKANAAAFLVSGIAGSTPPLVGEAGGSTVIPMGLMSFIGRLDRWAGRFNDWFGATAVAAHTGSEGAAERRPAADPTAVVALLGEIENDGKTHDDDPDDSAPRNSGRG